MALELHKSSELSTAAKIKLVVVGNFGAGKTRTASTWPAPLYIDAEGRLLSVRDRNVDSVKVNSSEDLTELRHVLESSPEEQQEALGLVPETLVIDTIDEISRKLITERLRDTHSDTMSGSDWVWLGEQLRGIVRGYRNLDTHLVINVHSKSVEDQETGGIFMKPAVQGGFADELAGFVDLVVLLVAKGQNVVRDGETRREVVRYMQTYPDSRYPWLKDHSNGLPMEFPINFEDDFARMHELIFNAGTKPKSAKVKAKKVIARPEPEPAQPVSVLEETVPEPESIVEEVPVRPEPTIQRVQPTPEPKPQEVEKDVPEAGTQAEDWQTCQVCGDKIENKDVADLSFIRFRKIMCAKDFKAAKTGSS